MWLSVWTKVQTVCIWSFLVSLKSRLVLPYWFQLIQIVLEKRPLNGGSGSSSSSSSSSRMTDCFQHLTKCRVQGGAYVSFCAILMHFIAYVIYAAAAVKPLIGKPVC